MKSYARLIVLAVLLTASIAPAQTRPARPARPVPGERSGGQMLERIRFTLGELKLSDEQKVKVDAIFRKAREGMDKLREEMEEIDPRDRMARATEFFQDIREELSAVLNADQKALLDKRIDEARRDFRERRGAGPATAPAAPAAPPPPRRRDAGPERPGVALERLREAMSKIDLTDEQKQKIKSLIEDVQSKGMALRQQAEAGENVREKGFELLQQTRQKVTAILTPAQQQKLRELLGDGPRPASRPMMGEDMMMDDMQGAARKRGKDARKAPPPAIKPTDSTAQPGTAAPQFALKKLDGALVQLSALKGRVVVLEFGSWTCPAFRERAAAMEKLKNDYSTRAQFFVVYTREAHAKGEWEVDRNKALEISVDQPTTIEARSELAKKSRDELSITVPIMLDTIGDEAAKAYGAGVNSAFVINRDGIIVARQQWFDPTGLRSAIDEAVKATPATAAAK